MIDPRLAARAIDADPVVCDMLTALRSRVLEARLCLPRAAACMPRSSSPRTMDVNVARRRVDAFLSA